MVLRKFIAIEDAKPGDVVHFTYHNNGDSGEKCGRVVEIRDTTERPLCRRTSCRCNPNRSRFLITIQEEKGRIRSYYHTNICNVYRLTLLAKALYWLIGAA